MKIHAALFALCSVVLAQTGSYQAEGLPDHLIARTEVRDRFLSELPPSNHGFGPQFGIETLKRWTPGSTVRVAFNGGDNALRKKVADAASVWLAFGNVRLDFGYNATNGSYRDWSQSAAQYSAEIRISFDQSGYWSLVGRDSSDAAIVRPGEASMNFGGFTIDLPGDWEAVVAHEFGHAFGFQHEHQSPLGGCDSQFRWYDDPGYHPKKDGFGQYIQDDQGRRPGLYTVLGGPPNNWPKSKVDFNLRQLPSSTAFNIGPFDSKSIMMYSFPDWMFVSPNSSCHTGENLVLSQQDQAGFFKTYPSSTGDVVTEMAKAKEFLQFIMSSPKLAPESKAHFQELLNTIH